MRFLIEHRGHYGFLGLRPRFTLHLQIQFSNEERAIVRARALQHYLFDLSPGYLASTETRHTAESLSMMMAGGLGLFILGFLSIFLAAAVPGFGPITLLMIVGGVVLFWRAQAARRRQPFVKEITVGQLVSHPSFAIQTVNPAQATQLEENIRSRLAKLKSFLTVTHELTTPRLFEL